MVRHVILWQLKDEIQGEEKEQILRGIKTGLEGLAGVVQGLEKVHVQTDKLESSNADAMLDTLLKDADALAGYQKHPAHVNVANTYVRPFVKARVCIDYEV